MKEKSQYAVPPKPNAEVEIRLIYPQDAAEILKRMEKEISEVADFNQRKRKTARVYTTDILYNRWSFNGESIIFDDKGVLIDGQNRLQAVVNSDTPTWFVVVTNIERRTMETIDSGKSRSLEDSIAVQDGNFTPRIGSIIKKKISLELKNKCSSHSSFNIGISRMALVDEYKANKSNYFAILDFARDISKRTQDVLKTHEVGGIYAYLVFSLGYDRLRVEAFFNELSSAQMGSKSIYRDCIIALAKNYRGAFRTEEIVRCWNAFALGRNKRPSLAQHPWFVKPVEKVKE